MAAADSEYGGACRRLLWGVGELFFVRIDGSGFSGVIKVWCYVLVLLTLLMLLMLLIYNNLA